MWRIGLWKYLRFLNGENQKIEVIFGDDYNIRKVVN